MYTDNHILPEYCRKRTLILGCGNRLFGDDGFGPAVVDYLSEHFEIPEDVYVMDVGTGVRKILFTLVLSEQLPEQILLIDAVDKERRPGEIFEIELDDIPFQKTDDFSLHQAPSSNLAKDLREKGVEVRVLTCQTERIDPNISVGLSPSVASAVQELSKRIAREFFFQTLDASEPNPLSRNR